MTSKMSRLQAAAHSRTQLREGRQEEGRGTMQAMNALAFGPATRISTNGLVLNPYNSRTIYTPAKVTARAISLKNSGQVQPILVAEMDDGQRIVVDGWTRKLASELLAKDESLPIERQEWFERIDAVVRTDLTLQDIAVLSFVANEEHNSLTDMDRAIGFAKALADGVFETQEQLAQAYGISQNTVSRLNGMATSPDPIKAVLMANPEKLTYSFFAEVTELDVTVQSKLLSDAAARDRSVAWLRTQVASCKKQDGVGPSILQEKLEDATIKWSTSSRAKAIEVTLRAKKDQIEAVALLTALFKLSRDNRELLARALQQAPSEVLGAIERVGKKE